MFQYLNSLTTYMVFKNRKHNIKKTNNNGTFSILVPDMTGYYIGQKPTRTKTRFTYFDAYFHKNIY